MLEKFTVIDLIKTRSNSIATVMENAIRFNNPTAQELFFAPYVQVLIDTKNKQFAIRACKDDAPNAVSFSKPEGEQKYQIKITFPAAADMIYKLMAWNPQDNWNVPGIYFAKESAIVYDLNTAFAPSSKGGWAVKKQKDEALRLAEEAVASSTEASEK